MTGQKVLRVRVAIVPHPGFSDNAPTCTNWPEADCFCNECRKTRRDERRRYRWLKPGLI